MWRRVFVTIVALTSLVACSASDFKVGSAPDPGRKCADILARFYTTDGTVTGTWSCLSSSIQNQYHALGKSGDSDISSPADLHHARFVAHDLHTPAGDSYIYFVWEEDKQGAIVAAKYLVVYTEKGGKVASATTTK